MIKRVFSKFIYRKMCITITAMIFIFLLLLSACGATSNLTVAPVNSSSNSNSTAASGTRDATPKILTPEASGIEVLEDEDAFIDISNTDQGYIMAKYTGTNPKVKLRVTGPDAKKYTYDLKGNEYDAFPLTSGNGNYKFNILENTTADEYSYALTESADVSIKDEYAPYLHPSQYVAFNATSSAVAKGSELAQGAATDLDVVSSVFNFVTKNVTYDTQKAQSALSGELNGYLPHADETLSTKKGICFDYAALMTAMLRSQGIPTKLVLGYATTAQGEVYHAWLSVYTEETGWIENVIQFNGASWTLMDPTFTSTSGQAKDFVGDGTGYKELYVY